VNGVRALVVAALLAVVLVSVLGAQRPEPPPPLPAARHLVLISIDGLRPEFYLDDTYATPELRALLRAGSHARAVEPVFPSVTYPNHASMVTGVRPARHGVLFNVIFDPTGERGRWYEEAADLKAPPLWEWVRGAGLRTAAVSWPSTLGASIDLLLPERDYDTRRQPLDLLRGAVTPGLFERLAVTPSAEIFKDVVLWDEFLAATAVAMIRDARPHLLLVHLVQADYFQHRAGRDGAEVRPAVARVDRHLGTIVRALREAVGEAGVVLVAGDHGFQDVRRQVHPNQALARAGLRGCPRAGAAWRATVHVAGGAAAVFVNPRDDAEAIAKAAAALRAEAEGHYTVLTRRDLDGLGAMTGAALALEAAPGYVIAGVCSGGIARRIPDGGAHGFLPSQPTMATGFVAAGDGVRAGVSLDRIRLIDVAPTAARLLGVPAPAVEGRVVEEILK
jgi:hypothetical protein